MGALSCGDRRFAGKDLGIHRGAGAGSGPRLMGFVHHAVVDTKQDWKRVFAFED